MFVKIKTLYKDEESRTITNLAALYSDKELLKIKIYELSHSELINNNVLNNKVILLKPNWVLHSRNSDDPICLRTNDNFVIAILELVLEHKPKKVIIGDAPIQGCRWDQMLSKEFYAEVNELSLRFSTPIEIQDFRKVFFDPKLNIKETLNSDAHYQIFNLGESSFLEPISKSSGNPFRVTYYNPDRLKESHSLGTHKYCITKYFFEADVVISIPKIKTHQKTGITGALKNLVGINGDKDFLPHHRIGGSGKGGDCYPGNNYLRYLSELTRDVANRNIGNFKYQFWVLISYILWHLNPPLKTHSLSASWYGNDTSWRMVLDLNQIAIYGKIDGTISLKPQRVLFSICDAIVAGQGDGPLNPIPLPLGVISFTNHSAMNDVSMATLMGFDIQRIALLKNAIDARTIQKSSIIFNGKPLKISTLKKHAIKTLPPPGWEKFLNL